ncbi:hypothetical protein NXY46_17720 [Bacteroides ovatus]|uniref:hypothetical protein n=1 Tax=Bacteroides ovatus TaxID=28116 RepID=UPI0020A7A4E2|nr:hypothetical protein [Bacteroides ovatus]MCS2298984.1 hypothetical protein [Bacteroides ovatus]MCS2562921.1 hypothetical protein [Bacteroides ovatus]
MLIDCIALYERINTISLIDAIITGTITCLVFSANGFNRDILGSARRKTHR